MLRGFACKTLKPSLGSAAAGVVRRRWLLHQGNQEGPETLRGLVAFYSEGWQKGNATMELDSLVFFKRF